MALALNRIDMNVKGDRVHINALLDEKGLLLLEKKIQALKFLLEGHSEANDIDIYGKIDPVVVICKLHSPE